LLQGEHKIFPTPKIILIDINMNELNGVNLLNNIRKNSNLKSILVFVITKTENDKNKVAALNLNVAGYIQKPMDSKSNIALFSKLNDYWNLLEYTRE
jgi:DNA-binding response OmpR family regulator